MRPVYYISRTMGETELAWHEVEKFVWSLVFAIKSWKSYLLPKLFVILTSNQLLPQVMKASSTPRITKWLLALQES